MKVKLSPEQEQAARKADNNKELMIEAEVIGLFLKFKLGDDSEHKVPTHIFQPSKTGLLPDLSSLKIIDHGNTLKLGEYEAAVGLIIDNLKHFTKGSH